MLNSCANGISVVNIDNGYGAGYLAAQINRMAAVSYTHLDVYKRQIQKKEMTADDVMKLAWTNACPDAEVPGLTVGDPKDVDGRTVEVQQKGE